jgi:hypothetical protein
MTSISDNVERKVKESYLGSERSLRDCIEVSDLKQVNIYSKYRDLPPRWSVANPTTSSSPAALSP